MSGGMNILFPFEEEVMGHILQGISESNYPVLIQRDDDTSPLSGMPEI